MSSKSDSEHLCLNLRCKQMFYEVEDVDGEKPEKPYGSWFNLFYCQS